MQTEVFRGILIPFLGTILGSVCVVFMKNRLNLISVMEQSEGKHSNLRTVLFAVGFTVMMALDVVLG